MDFANEKFKFLTSNKGYGDLCRKIKESIENSKKLSSLKSIINK